MSLTLAELDIDVITNNEINLDLSDEPELEFDSSSQINMSGTNDHSMLINRDAVNQHPIAAITGLDDELAEALTNEEIENILSGFTAL